MAAAPPTAFAVEAAARAQRGGDHYFAGRVFPTSRLLSAKAAYRAGRQPAVVVACGAFNPATLLHLRMFEMARDTLRAQASAHTRTSERSAAAEATVSRIAALCVPCKHRAARHERRCAALRSAPLEVIGGFMSPVSDAYGKPGLLPWHERTHMCDLALADDDWVAVDSWEASQPTFQLTAWVLAHFHRQIDSYFEHELNSTTAAVRDLPLETGSDKPVTLPPHTPAFSDPNGDNMKRWLANHCPSEDTLAKATHCTKCGTELACGTIDGVVSQNDNSITDVDENDDYNDDLEWYPPVRLIIVAGSDLIQSFSVPNLWERADLEYIVGEHGCCIVERGGVDTRDLVAASSVLSAFTDNIYRVVQPVTNDVSSTVVRTLASQGLSVRYLVPMRVAHYIEDHGLYNFPRSAAASRARAASADVGAMPRAVQ